MKETKGITINQDAEEPIAAEILAQAIIDISTAMARMNRSGLKRRAIVALIHDQSKVTKKNIEIVLSNLDALRKDWCSK